jgi:ubiquinone/menaquinone biosynthesis C-methylase UbiE
MDVFLHPQKIIEQAYVGEGMTVADIGAGAGYYAILLARTVGDFGKVYAIDVQAELLSKIKREADKYKFGNIGLIAADVEKDGATGLEDGSVDRIFLANVFFQLDDKDGALRECKRILKKNGRVVLVEWQDSFSQLGPHSDHVMKKDPVTKLFATYGFKVDREIEAGSHHYGIIFKL